MDFDLSEYEPSGIPLVPSSLVVPLSSDLETIVAPASSSSSAAAPIPAEGADPVSASVSESAADSDKTPVPFETVKLPRFWRRAFDDRGRVYYFHVRFRAPQWELPSVAEETPEFSSESDDDGDSVTGDVQEEDQLVEVNGRSCPKEQERAKRRSLLCQEKIISPRSELECSDDAQRYRELKERLLRQKLSRIRERGIWIEEKKVKTKEVDKVKDKHKLNEKEKERLRKRAKEKYKKVTPVPQAPTKRKVPKVEVLKMDDVVVGGGGSTDGEEVAASDKYDEEGAMYEDTMNLDEEDAAEEKDRNRDVSANTVRKIKDAFRMKISSVIVQILNPYRRPDCKTGRISCTDDFKHLARKVYNNHFHLSKSLLKNVQHPLRVSKVTIEN